MQLSLLRLRPLVRIRMHWNVQPRKMWQWIQWRPLWHGEDRSPSDKPLLIGRSHGKLGHFTATRLRWNEVSWDEVRWGEVCETNTRWWCNVISELWLSRQAMGSSLSTLGLSTSVPLWIWKLQAPVERNCFFSQVPVNNVLQLLSVFHGHYSLPVK